MTKNERIKLLEDNQVVYRKRIEFLGSNIQLLQQDLLASTEYSNDRVNNLDRNINARFDKISKEKEKEKTELIGIPFQLDKYGDVVFKDKRINPDAFFNYFIDENIDQSNIKGIFIEMQEPK